MTLQDAELAADASRDGFDEAPSVPDAETRQFISFAINDEYFGVDIMSVREIKGWTEVTSLPNQPAYVRGVLNLRGVVVPIFDLRRKFGGGQTEATPMHVIIIVSVARRMCGLLVDRVSDILTFAAGDVQAVPDAANVSGAGYLSGIVTINEQMIALLNLEELCGDAYDAAAEARLQQG